MKEKADGVFTNTSREILDGTRQREREKNRKADRQRYIKKSTDAKYDKKKKEKKEGWRVRGCKSRKQKY